MPYVYNPFINNLDQTGSGGGGTGILTITGTSGGAVSADGANNINLLGTANQIVASGNPGTNTVTLSFVGPYTPATYTAHGVLIGEGTSSIAATSAGTALQVLQSGGAGADPNWSTATYPATTTVSQLLYSSSSNVVAGITTANDGVLITSNTGVPSWLANGTTGQVLTATTGSPPSWSAAAGGGITGTTTQYDVIVGAGVNLVGAVGPGTALQVLQSGGAAANPAYSTATYPATTTVSQLLYSSSSNVVAGLSTANDGLLVTSNTGVPSILAGPGTTANMLQSNAAAAPSFSTNTWPSTNAAGDLIYGSASNVVGKLVVSTNVGCPLITSDTGLPAYQNPRNYVWLYDEFISNASTSSLGWNARSANSGSSVQNSTYNSNANPGIMNLRTSSNAAGTLVLTMGTGTANSVQPFTFGGGFISQVWCMKISALSGSGDTYNVRIGFGTGNTTDADYTDGAWFQYTDTVNSGNWVIKTASASSVTSANTSTAATATGFHRFRIDVNAAATSVAFYIDDVQVANSPITLTIPTTGISPTAGIYKTGGTNDRDIIVDYYTFYQNLTSAR